MQLVFHAGVHFTQAARLMGCLEANSDLLHARDVHVPKQAAYRQRFRELFGDMGASAALEHQAAAVLAAIMGEAQATRILLSNTHFFGVPRAALRRGVLYPKAAERMGYLSRLFHGHDVRLCLAIKNPALYLPECYEQSPYDTADGFMDDVDPRAIRWSETLAAIREAAPQVPITVWCNEDAPLIWPRIIREIAGLPPGTPVAGAFDLATAIMTDEGQHRFLSHIDDHPDLSEAQQMQVMIEHLEQFAREEAVEETISFGDWTADTIDELTALYDEDVAAIARIPGVEVIAP